MDKIFQILVVFALMILLIYRFIRRESRYRPYDFRVRLRPPLPLEVEERLIAAHLVDGEGYELEMGNLFFIYKAEGSLVIFRRNQQGKTRQVQELAVAVDCTAMAMDPQDHQLYLEAGGYWFVYGSERTGGPLSEGRT